MSKKQLGPHPEKSKPPNQIGTCCPLYKSGTFKGQIKKTKPIMHMFSHEIAFFSSTGKKWVETAMWSIEDTCLPTTDAAPLTRLVFFIQPLVSEYEYFIIIFNTAADVAAPAHLKSHPIPLREKLWGMWFKLRASLCCRFCKKPAKLKNDWVWVRREGRKGSLPCLQTSSKPKWPSRVPGPKPQLPELGTELCKPLLPISHCCY